MTDTRTTPTSKRFKLKSLKAALSAAMAIIAPSIQAADDQWWFDVEVIVFERQIEQASILEQFEQSSLEPPTGQLIDLLTPYIKPDLSYLRAGLPYCRESKRLEIAEKYQQDFALPVSDKGEDNLPSADLAELASAPNDIEKPALSDKVEQPKDTFEYEVASADIFSTETDMNTVTVKDDPELPQPLEAETLIEQDLVHVPIQVNFIEWQIPSVFPCVYSEQIDPILALIEDNKDNQKPQSFVPDIKAVPVEIDGIDWQQKRRPFLLPKDTFRMAELFDKIEKQRDITPILHLNWRQQVLFGHENAKEFRLFTGKNFAGQFDANGQVIVEDTDQLMTSLHSQHVEDHSPSQVVETEYGAASIEQEQKQTQDTMIAEQASEKLFAQIDAALEDDSPVSYAIPVNNSKNSPETTVMLSKLEDIWQLDGGIKVYLQNVGRVPYLHIDSHLDYRHAIYNAKLAPQFTEGMDNAIQLTDDAIAALPPPNYLQSVTFDQLRRVISKQVHYFDHPLFGMIVRIHRYRWPEPDYISEDGAEE